MKKITLKFFPNDLKVNSRTGKTPLYMRVWAGGTKTEIRLDWELNKEERELWNDILQRVDFKESYTNRFLDGIELKFTQLKFSEFKEIHKMSVQEIRDFILGIKHHSKKTMTVFNYAKDYYHNNIENNNKYQASTKTNYRKALNHLKAFVMLSEYEFTRINSLNYDFARAFCSYLMSNDPKTGRIGMSEVSACGIIKKFRTIYNQAIEEELLLRNPFMQIKLSSTSPHKPNLSLSQIKELFHNDSVTEMEKSVLDLFFLMSLTGCAFTDCQRLTSHNIEKLSDGDFRLKYNRGKTGLESQQFLTGQALSILENFEQRPDVQTSDFLVPRVSNQHMNRTLKSLATRLSISIRLTSHTSRHTFRQLLDEADIVDQTVVNQMMGWSNRAGMDSVYRRVTDTRLLKTKARFEHFLNSIMLIKS